MLSALHQPAVGGYKLKDLRNDMVQRLINSLDERGIAIDTIRKTRWAIHAAITQAIENGLLAKNVADKVTLPLRKREEARVLSVEEQDKFVAFAKKAYHGPIFLLILGTGLRIGEAMGLTWDDIDLEGQMLTVSRTHIEVKDPDNAMEKWHVEYNTPKTKSSIRTVPLLPGIVTMLEGIKEEQEANKAKLGAVYEVNNLVFCTPFGKPFRANAVRKGIRRIGKKAGITGIHPHCLRHTFATRGLENGIELKVMQELLGHSSISMTANLYTHVLPDKKLGSVMKLQHTISF